MTFNFSYSTSEQKEMLVNVIRKEAENRFKFDYSFGIFTENKVVVHVKKKAFLEDLGYSRIQMIKKTTQSYDGVSCISDSTINDFLSAVENNLNYYVNITVNEE